MVAPVQAISRGGSTTWRIEVRELGPAFHRKTVPGWTGPSTRTDLMSGFQDGHWSMAAITENTVDGSASIRSSPSAVAGALRLISMGILQSLHAAQPDDRPSRTSAQASRAKAMVDANTRTRFQQASVLLEFRLPDSRRREAAGYARPPLVVGARTRLRRLTAGANFLASEHRKSR
jgi:hypothetical protein